MLRSAVTSGEGAERPESDELRAGRRVARYVLVERIGEGGMGVVWAAHDPELDRRVAVKLVHSHSASARARGRLLREAQAMAKLSHPAVVPVFDVGAVGDQLFIAMELVDGVTLRQALAGASAGAALAMFVAAGRGLAAAHDAGIVHRDFKPENVLVGRDRRVRVTDFGIARLAAADDVADIGAVTEPWRPLTRAGTILGTPRYMAPEQRRGEPADARSDQFSFCLALWEAVLGSPPRAQPASMRPSLGSTATAQHSWPVPPSARPASSVDPPEDAAAATHGDGAAAGGSLRRSPSWLRRILMRGLAPDPAERWLSMTELLDALEQTPLRRRRIVGWVAAGVGAAAAAALMFALARNDSASADPCGAQPARLAGVWDEAVRARGLASFEATRSPLARPTWDRVVARLDTYAGAWLGRARDRCAATRDLGESEDVGMLRDRCLDGRLAELGALATALTAVDRAGVEHAIEAAGRLPDLAICDDVAALRELPLPPSDATQRAGADALGRELDAIQAQKALGNYPAALERAEQAVLAARALGYAPREARALYEAGWLKLELGRDHALEDLEAASERADVAHDDRLRFEALAQIIEVRVKQSRLDAARVVARQARAVLDRIGSAPKHEVQMRFSEALIARAEEASPRMIAMYEEAVLWAQRIAPRDELLISTARLNLAQAYVLGERVADGLAQMALGRSGLIDALGPEHPRIALLYVLEGSVAASRTDYTAALAAFERAVAVYDRALGVDSKDALNARYDVGLMDLQLHRYDAAARVFQAAIPVAVRYYGPDHIEVGGWLTSLGEAYLNLGDTTRAIEQAQRGMAIAERHPEAPSELANAWVVLGEALWQSAKDRPRASTLLRKARAVYVAGGAAQANQVRQLDDWMRARGVH
jgi:tetratricopeptide (TPR) repeat protein